MSVYTAGSAVWVRSITCLMLICCRMLAEEVDNSEAGRARAEMMRLTRLRAQLELVVTRLQKDKAGFEAYKVTFPPPLPAVCQQHVVGSGQQPSCRTACDGMV